MRKDTAGFTIVELLIVVVVIAILAAITIVSYNGITNQANDTAVKNDLQQLSKRMEIFKIESGLDRYPNISSDFTTNLGVKFSKNSYNTSVTNSAIYCGTADGSSYIFIGLSKSGTSWAVGPNTAPREYTGAGIASTGYASQTVICPAALPGVGTTTNNTWAFTGGSWNPWTN